MEGVTFKGIVLKTMVVHTGTYFIMGVLAVFIMDYTTMFESPVMKEYMRPIDHVMVRSGILFQPLRGFLFGLVFYVFREVIFAKKEGWKSAWLMLTVVGIFSTFGAAPGSIEGFVYTQLPIRTHIRGLPETLIQVFLLAYVTHYWVTRPPKNA